MRPGRKEPSNASINLILKSDCQRQPENDRAEKANNVMPAGQDWAARPLPSTDGRPDDTKALVMSLKWTLGIVKLLAAGYYASSRFQCDKALKAYGRLAHDQQQTPWVLGQLGRAYLEQGAYHEAEKVFRALRVLAPTRLRDMEVYSTVLWHLGRQVELSLLAHELLDLSWHSPEA
jgi:anaphase-promoting complex subunit 3